ncbi:MAG: L,D-transpeptidase family protein, partial [Terracidiphilus sp.]
SSGIEDSMKAEWILCCTVLMGVVSVGSLRGEEPAALHASAQILVVKTQDWNAVDGVLQAYERPRAHKRWKAVGGPIPVVVGENGLGWGVGLVSGSDEKFRRASDPVKHEGDGKSPAGIFRLSTSFGYAAEKQAGWKMPYVHLTPSVECVDDANSKFYNRVLDRAKVTPDWNSSEHMLRSDELYKWGLVADHNADPATPGVGSCIFVHIWMGPGQGTTGCTAMTEEHLEGVLAWLDPAKNPLLVQLPRGEYQKLRRHWKLPALPRGEAR